MKPFRLTHERAAVVRRFDRLFPGETESQAVRGLIQAGLYSLGPDDVARITPLGQRLRARIIASQSSRTLGIVEPMRTE
jgi:hypothetical protein